MSDLPRRLLAELVGTAVLLVAVVGSGIVVTGDGPPSAQLFRHAIVVGLVLAVLVVLLLPVSGAHLNPVVTVVDAALGGLPWRAVPGYLVAQLAGAVTGAVTTNLLFGLPAVTVATTGRSGGALVASEALATGVLVLVILGLVRSGSLSAIGPAVGGWIAAAIVLSPSSSFANPAVTVARALSDTYTGIAPVDVPGFVAGQVAGAALAVAVAHRLFPTPDPGGRADRHDRTEEAV